MNEASAILPIVNSIIPKSHGSACDSVLIIYYHNSYVYIAFVELKKLCDHKKCAIMEIHVVVHLSVGVHVLLVDYYMYN